MKKGGGHYKGSSFEREISVRLSLWWTQNFENPREDIFWRTSGSGARATSRSKSKKKTAYEHGDITFIDPIGKPFIDCFLIECKRGYSDEIDILDLFHREEKSTIYFWWTKILKEAEIANRKNCLLIFKRNRRPELCMINKSFFDNFHPYLGNYPHKTIEINKNSYIIRLDDFLSWLNSEVFELYNKINLRLK